jgi:hypothetical protein
LGMELEVTAVIMNTNRETVHGYHTQARSRR